VLDRRDGPLGTSTQLTQESFTGRATHEENWVKEWAIFFHFGEPVDGREKTNIESAVDKGICCRYPLL